MRTAFALLAAAALTGCNSAATHEPTAAEGPGTAVAVDESFTLAPGDSATLPEAELRLRFLAVPEDSRCPVDVTCVWEGDAAVAVETLHAGVERVWTLHAPGERVGPRAVDLDGYTLELVGLAPEPRSGTTIPPGSYRATFRVRAAGQSG